MKRLSLYNLKSYLLIGFLCFFVASAMQVSAFGLIDAQNTLSRERVLIPSNHTVVFETPSGVLIGQDVQLTFPAVFTNVSSILSSDVDIYDDGVLVPVSDWTFVNSGSDLIFTFLVPVAASSTLEFHIGLHAGSGVNQIVNPALPGTYHIEIQGAFGDDGLIAVPILSDEQLYVSAKVLDNSSASNVNCVLFGCLFDKHDSILQISAWTHHQGRVFVYVNGRYIETVYVGENGFFSTSIENFVTGAHSVFLIAYDDDGFNAPLYQFDVDISYGGVTVVDGIFLAPTIDLYSINGNGSGHLHGDTLPFAAVDIYRDGVLVETVYANELGHWNHNFQGLDPFVSYDFSVVAHIHGLTSVRSYIHNVYYETDIFQLPVYEGPVEYIYSNEYGALDRQDLCLRGDVSRDGVVSLQDLSVAHYYRENNFDSDDSMLHQEKACLDGTKSLTLKDYSIISYYWQQKWQNIKNVFKTFLY